MHIECTIKRPVGSTVELDGHSYNFLPIVPDNIQSPHVAEVTNPSHVKRLLSIDAYEIYDGPAVNTQALSTSVEEKPTPLAQDAAAAASGRGAAPEDATDTAPISTDAAPATDAADDGDDTVTEPIPAPVPADNEPATEFDGMSDEELRKLHEDETGRKPHHKAKAETMIASIQAARAERG